MAYLVLVLQVLQLHLLSENITFSCNNNFLKGASSMVEHLPYYMQEVGGSIPPCPIINL